MDQNSAEGATAVPSLVAAMRTARGEAAERSEAVASLRGAELARLEVLHEALEPVFAQVPADVDLFDTGIVPGDRPRLFIDMVAFVDMHRDRRRYRFHLDTRHGRVLIAESEDVAAIVFKVTDYIARRLIERETALSSVSVAGFPARVPARSTTPLPPAPLLPAPPPTPSEPPPEIAGSRLANVLRLGIQGLGILAFVWLGMHLVQGRIPAW